MDTIIIKNLCKIIFISFSFFFISCATQSTKINLNKNRCKLYEDNLSRVIFSENQDDSRSIQLNEFYDGKNIYDILIYNHTEGSNNYELRRFYKSVNGEWNIVTIIDDHKDSSVIAIEESEISNYFAKVQAEAFFQFCGNCFDCTYYTLLIKNKDVIFKYYSNGILFSEIDDENTSRIDNYANIYNFFSEKR